MIKRPKFIKSTVAPNPKEYDFWVDLQEDPQGGIIKKYNVAEHKWEKIVSGTSNGRGIGESPNDNEFKDYSAQVANNLFELTKPKEYGPINHFREKIDLKRSDSPQQFGILITCENEFYVQQYENILRKFIKEWKKNPDAYSTVVNKLKFYIVVPLNLANAITYESKDNLFDLQEDDIIFTRTANFSVSEIINYKDIFHAVFHQKQEDLDADLYDKTSWFDDILKTTFRNVERKSVIQTYPYANYAFRDREDYQNTQLSMFHKINDACDMYYQNGYDIIPAGTAVLRCINSIPESGPDYVNVNTLSLPNAYVYCSTVLYDVLTNYIFVGIGWLNENKHNIIRVSDDIREARAFPYYQNIGFVKKVNIISMTPSDQAEINLKPTEQFQLRYTSDPFIPNLFEYISTDETVAKVNKRGLITAISPGSCKIRWKKRNIVQPVLPGLLSLPEDTQVIPECTIIVSNENDIESNYSNSKIFNNTLSYIFKPYNRTGVIKPTTIYIKKDDEVAHSGEKLNISSMKINRTVIANLKEINNTKEFWFSQHFCPSTELPLNFGAWKVGVFSQNSEIMLYTENNAENPLNFGFCTNLYHKDIIKNIYNIQTNSKIGIQYVLFDKVGNSNIISPVFQNDTTSAFRKFKNYYNEHEAEYSDYVYCAFNFVTLSNEINDSEYNSLIDITFNNEYFS